MTDRNRKTAYSVLWDVERKDAYANLALNARIANGRPENPAFVRELVYGVLENRILLDWEIEPFLRQPFAKLGLAEKILLRLGFWQILFAEKIPPFAAVSETVDLAKDVAKGREGFINAVLRSLLRARETAPPDALTVRPLPDRGNDPVRHLSVRFSADESIVRLWLRDYGPARTEEMLLASLVTPPVSIRPNGTKMTKGELAGILKKELPALSIRESRIAGNALIVSGGSVLDTEAYRNGLFSVQEETSVRAVEVLGPLPGETVYDVCAAPGGKTLAIAEAMKGKGTLVACDVSGPKLGRIKKEAKRLGLPVPRLLVRNAATGRAPADPASAASAELFLLPESADRVLVDAPCSGLGMLARKPEIKLREPDPDRGSLPEKQLAILRESAKLVKPGGTLVYSTCTVSRAENEGVVRAFLGTNAAPEPDEPADPQAERKTPEWMLDSEHQYYPAPDGTDGFYIARLVRKGTL